MLPFRVEIKPGSPPYEQVIYAVKKALVQGLLQPGDAFPSVRVLSQELRINPNTAHKVVAALIHEGLLSPRPGVGTVILPLAQGNASDRAALLGGEVERLVVEAKKLRLNLNDVQESVRKHWNQLGEKD